jgi:hypothetical protein
MSTKESHAPRDEWKRVTLFCVGFSVLLLTLMGGFGNKYISVEGALANIYGLNANDQRFNGIFILERWALLALFSTSIFTIMTYIFFSYDLFKLAMEGTKNIEDDQSPWVVRIAIGFPFLVFPIIFLALLFAHVYLIQLGHQNEFASVNLKYGTGILLSLYIVTFVIASFLCTRNSIKSTKKGQELYKEVKFFFYRLDLPLFISFACLFFFTSGVLGVVSENLPTLVSTQAVNAFAAGASAFKLLVASIFYVTYTVVPEV